MCATEVIDVSPIRCVGPDRKCHYKGRGVIGFAGAVGTSLSNLRAATIRLNVSSEGAALAAGVSDGGGGSGEEMVSALCLFLHHDLERRDRRRKTLTHAVKLWRDQTWGNLELVVLHHTDDRETAAMLTAAAVRLDPKTRRIVAVPVDSSANVSLGAARNLAIAAAAGVYVATWDDDDLHHPHRIEASVVALRCACKGAVMLDSVLMHTVTTRTTFTTPRYPMAGTLVARRAILRGCYSDSARGEDVPCHRRLVSTGHLVIAHGPHLYTYVATGDNLSEKKHFAELRKGSKKNSATPMPADINDRIVGVIKAPAATTVPFAEWPTAAEVDARCS
jgi:hypothetical protein